MNFFLKVIIHFPAHLGHPECVKSSPRASTTAQAPLPIRIVEGRVELNPEYIRISKIPLVFGLSRSLVFLLIARGVLESVLIKQPNASRGIRLVSTASLRRYIASFAK